MDFKNLCLCFEKLGQRPVWIGLMIIVIAISVFYFGLVLPYFFKDRLAEVHKQEDGVRSLYIEKGDFKLNLNLCRGK